jgi:hypothetical protein
MVYVVLCLPFFARHVVATGSSCRIQKEDEHGDRVTISRALLSKVAIAYPDSLPAVVADLTARDEDDEFVVHIPRGETTPLHVRDVRTAINHTCKAEMGHDYAIPKTMNL